MSSGGTLKSIVARGLITNPEALTLDEPITGLDITA